MGLKILIVASFNRGRFAPFIIEQAEALKDEGCEVEWFGLQGKGAFGYLHNLSLLKKKILSFHPDVVHAHYGLSGLLANMQRKVPVVVTYHGSDINEPQVLRFSKMTMRLSAWNVFVSRKTLEIAKPKRDYSMIPCGIDLSSLKLTEKRRAREQMRLEIGKRYILFAGAFDNEVKNAPLAQEAMALMDNDEVELLELNGYTRDEVTLLMCAVDAFLMTSISEGSPQVIKEALACGCPIVSVDVGDVKERTEGVDGCYVSSSREAKELAELLQKALSFEGKTKGREKMIADGLDNRIVARQLLEIYRKVCQK